MGVFISVRAAAEQLGVTRYRVYKLLNEGRIKGAVKVGPEGGVWQIPKHFSVARSRRKFKKIGVRRSVKL